jgi:hypothetical protein
MPDIVIAITDKPVFGSETTFRLPCTAFVSGPAGEQAGYEVEVSYASNAAQINSAIVDAAIAAYAQSGIIIGPSDKKIIMGGAVVN